MDAHGLHNPGGAIDLHSHIVTPEILALLEREGEHYATRVIVRAGQHLFLIGETATRPINAKILGSERGAARLRDMDAEGVECEVLSCVPFVMYPGVPAERGLAVAQVHQPCWGDWTMDTREPATCARGYRGRPQRT